MDKFQIVEVIEQNNNASTKAPSDAAEIAEAMGFAKLFIRMRSTKKEGIVPKAVRQAGYFFDWDRCLRTIPKGAAVFLQHPFHNPQLTREKTLKRLKNEKGVRFVSLVHDVEELRDWGSRADKKDYYAAEFAAMLCLADVLIVHNEKMKSFFLDKGVSEKKLVTLELFDYLQSGAPEKPPKFEKSITVAGNLDTSKSRYILELGRLDGVKVNLYGPNYNDEMNQYKNIAYHGSFPPNELISRLNSGFGLVWDGESADCCGGKYGEYLRFNNPHKLSLYLSCGLPVVVWSEAATAGFVLKNECGIAVRSLDEAAKRIEKMSEAEYERLAAMAGRVGGKLRSGGFLRSALLDAESVLKTL